MKTLLAFCFCLVSCFHAFAQYHIEVLDSNNFQIGEGVILHKTSFRGLSVVDDQTIWVSGSRGTIARSIDGGKTFVYKQLKKYPKSDFRDVEAFDANRAIIMSSGTPALILKTTDGGETWKEVFRKNDSAYFLDAMDFWDEKRGILVGDPINNHFVLLQTTDGGETWQELDTSKTPVALEGEAVFAASGTSLRCWGKNEYGFVTGGKRSRFLYSKMKNSDFEMHSIKMNQGTESAGTFSFTKSKVMWLFAGGDYTNDTVTHKPNFYYCNKLSGAENTIIESENMNGYKSSIELLSDYKKNLCGYPTFIATGTSGTQIARRICTFMDIRFMYTNHKQSFHVVRKAKKGKAVFLAGPNGKIGKLLY